MIENSMRERGLASPSLPPGLSASGCRSSSSSLHAASPNYSSGSPSSPTPPLAGAAPPPPLGLGTETSSG